MHVLCCNSLHLHTPDVTTKASHMIQESNAVVQVKDLGVGVIR